MKRLMIAMAVAVSMAVAMAQERPNRPDGPGGRHAGNRPMPHVAMQAGPWVARILSEKPMLESFGVTDEETLKSIIDAMTALKKKSDDLESRIREISREQGQQMRSLLDDKSKDSKPVFDKVEEIAKLRGEQGRIAVEAILVLRDKLSPEQLEKARTLIFERGRARGQMRRGGRDGERHEPPSEGRRQRRRPKTEG